MKLTERLGAGLMAVALWIFIAFVFGVIARPVAEAFLFGFRLWSN